LVPFSCHGRCPILGPQLKGGSSCSRRRFYLLGVYLPWRAGGSDASCRAERGVIVLEVRYVVVGAGAVGGVVGGRLALAGRDVVLVARGAHLEAIRAQGLRLESPDGTETVHAAAVASPSEVAWAIGDVAVIAVKGQATLEVVRALAVAAPPDLPVLCMQNGVENERVALRWFEHVHGACVALPSEHWEPGVVAANSAPIPGILDMGRWPTGADATDDSIAADLCNAGFAARAVDDIARWKYAKLLRNLGNALDALSRNAAADGELATRIADEGEAVLRAAGVEAATREEEAVRRGDLLHVTPIAGRERGGSSTWQSLARGTGNVETAHINGEIALLGRLHGVPTPANALLQREAERAAGTGAAPGSLREADLLARLRSSATAPG